MLPEGNQVPLMIKDKVGGSTGELWASKSMECDLQCYNTVCWLVDRKGIQSVKSWVLVCWW